MKKIAILFVCMLASSCYTTYKVIPKTYDYTENVSFTIDKVEEGKSIALGNGSYNASRGSKFVFVFITLINSADQKQDLNFDDFNLVNKQTNTKYKPEWSMVTGPVNMFGNIDSHIAKGDKKRRKLVYIFPESDKATTLLVGEKLIEIEYAQ